LSHRKTLALVAGQGVDRMRGWMLLVGSWLMFQAAGQAQERVLKHVVLYQFKAGLTAAQVQEVVDAFAALPRQIDTILGFEHGTNVSQEGKSEGLTHLFVVTFRNQADLEAYLVHPAHQAYVNLVRDRREKVIVFDYWATR
jgi:quinol monooxygenase YgiN